jgi:hypothetical protein
LRAAVNHLLDVGLLPDSSDVLCIISIKAVMGTRSLICSLFQLPEQVKKEFDYIQYRLGIHLGSGVCLDMELQRNPEVTL